MSWDNSKTLASNEEKQCEHRFKACLDAQVIYMKPHSVVIYSDLEIRRVLYQCYVGNIKMYLQNGIRAGNWRFDADETEKDRSHKIWISGMVESKNNTFYNSHAMIMSRKFFLIFRWKVQYEKSEQNRRKKSLDSILRCFLKKIPQTFYKFCRYVTLSLWKWLAKIFAGTVALSLQKRLAKILVDTIALALSKSLAKIEQVWQYCRY